MKSNQLFKRMQAGLTLIEVLVSLAILSAASIGMSMLADRFSQDTKGSVTASQMRTFGEASKAYIKDHYADVQALATPTTPALINLDTLVTAGKLPAGFLGTDKKNAFGQSMCTLVLENTDNRLQAMVITEGGAPIEDLALGSIAATVGGSGGGVYAATPAVMRGAIGGWELNTTTYHNLINHWGKRCDLSAGNVQVTAGHLLMALWFENGDTSSTFLSRDAVPNRPDLNAMSTPLVMNSVQTVSAACTATGAIAQDGAGRILSCQAGLWKFSGDGKCVGTSSDLNNLQTDGRCYNGVNLPNSPAGGDWVFIEVYRHINPANYYTAQRVVGMTGGSVGRVWQRNQQSGAQTGGWSAWVQQADRQVSINAGGNVTAAGTVKGGRGEYSRDGTGPCCGDTGTLSLAESTSTTGRKASISLHNGGYDEGNIELTGPNSSGYGSRRIRFYDNQGQNLGLETTGNVVAGGTLEIKTKVTRGNSCTTSGTIATDTAGVILSCQSGVWKGSSDSSSQYVYTNWTFYEAVTLTNNYGKTLLVMASGGEQNSVCGNNNYNLNVSVNGTFITGMHNGNQSYHKTGAVTFLVPAGSTYTVTSYPYNCPYGRFTLAAATF